jgi:hypothetical protein
VAPKHRGVGGYDGEGLFELVDPCLDFARLDRVTLPRDFDAALDFAESRDRNAQTRLGRRIQPRARLLVNALFPVL